MSPSEPVVTFVSPQSLPFDGNFGIPAAYIAGDFITLPPFAMAPNSRPTSVNYIRRFSSMDAADRIRVAILGCGMMGQEHISYIAGYENLRLDYLCDPYEPSLEKSIAMWKQFQHASTTMQQQEEGHVPILLREEQDLLEYADKIDLLVIASPNYLHTDSIARWAPYDLTILVEKPVAVSQEQHDALTRLSEQQACDYCARIWVAMEYRYIPAIAKMLSLLPTIGALKMVTIRENRYPFLHKIGKWNRDPIKTGDTLVEKCCHFFDLFRLITGKEVSKKGVKALVQRGINYEEEEIVTTTPIIDSAYVMMPFREQQQGAKKQQQHAVMGCLELCMYAEGSRHQEEIIVTGTKGRLEAYLPENKVYHFERPSGELWNDRSVPPPPSSIKQTVYDCSDVKSVHGIDSELHMPTHGGYHYSSTAVEWFQLITAIYKYRETGAWEPQVSLQDGLRAVEIGLCATKSVVVVQDEDDDVGEMVLPVQSLLYNI